MCGRTDLYQERDEREELRKDHEADGEEREEHAGREAAEVEPEAAGVWVRAPRPPREPWRMRNEREGRAVSSENEVRPHKAPREGGKAAARALLLPRLPPWRGRPEPRPAEPLAKAWAEPRRTKSRARPEPAAA